MDFLSVRINFHFPLDIGYLVFLSVLTMILKGCLQSNISGISDT